MSGRISTFADFWPFYLGEHSLPATRWFHFVGSWVALLNLALAVAIRAPLFALSALLSGYAFAWVSHFVIEKNRPATFTYPVWSFAADWKMWAMMMSGRLDAELLRLGVVPRQRTA